MPMKVLSVKVSRALDAKLTSIAQQGGTRKSAVVRAALEAFVSRGGKRRVGTALALAKDLAGCLAGPGDLSFNKDHLKEFGR
jgi:predicted transcriptional regulator